MPPSRRSRASTTSGLPHRSRDGRKMVAPRASSMFRAKSTTAPQRKAARGQMPSPPHRITAQVFPSLPFCTAQYVIGYIDATRSPARQRRLPSADKVIDGSGMRVPRAPARASRAKSSIFPDANRPSPRPATDLQLSPVHAASELGQLARAIVSHELFRATALRSRRARATTSPGNRYAVASNSSELAFTPRSASPRPQRLISRFMPPVAARPGSEFRPPHGRPRKHYFKY